MRRVSMTTRGELIGAVATRYRQGGRGEKVRILDEFVAVTGYHRKHAMRLLRKGNQEMQPSSRLDRRVYDDAVRQALVLLWEASDRICGKRLEALVPVLIPAMEEHGHITLAMEVRVALLAMSASTIDRVLRPQRERAEAAKRQRSSMSVLRRSIPVRTFSDWNDPPPGFVEADLVSHSGPVASGSFAHTFVLTDIASGWTECAPLLVREQSLVVAVIDALRAEMPFPLLGLDTDNDSVFMNETVRDYCVREGIVFTRCRPYRKNDQAHVEQKNGAIVRRIVGYRRFEGLAAARELGRLYAATRLFVNAFQPSFKLAEKERDGAMVKKRYHAPTTPCDRLLIDARLSEAVRNRVKALRAGLDPVALLAEIRCRQQALVEINERASTDSDAPVPIAEFVTGLRTAWQSGEVRPTAKPKPGKRRERRRPDPIASVTEELRSWFYADPSQSGQGLLNRLQEAYPQIYPDALLRTVQRRVKGWRSEVALGLVFGPGSLAGRHVASGTFQ